MNSLMIMLLLSGVHMLKNATMRFKDSDADNASWLLANTKSCPNPKCGKPIEKN